MERGPTIGVRLGRVEGSGISRKMIRHVVRSHLDELRACYNRGLLRDPNLSGRVETQFVIGPNGEVTAAVVTGGSLVEGEVRRCIQRSIRRWTFPAARTHEPTRVHYPFTFSAH